VHWLGDLAFKLQGHLVVSWRKTLGGECQDILVALFKRCRLTVNNSAYHCEFVCMKLNVCGFWTRLPDYRDLTAELPLLPL
jgi:hypothetical protein